MKNFAKKHQGFTLVELLVVIAIIGILSSIVVVSIGPVRQAARDSARKSDISQIFTAQELYNDANLVYYATDTEDAGIPAIGAYLVAMNDPGCPGGSCVGTQVNYKWLDNDGNSDRFCAYATMEDKAECGTTRYWAVSERGTNTMCDTAPATYACW